MRKSKKMDRKIKFSSKKRIFITMFFLSLMINPILFIFNNLNYNLINGYFENSDQIIGEDLKELPSQTYEKSNFDSYNSHFNQNLPQSSDVAGSELYGEQIGAFVAGSNTIMRHSFITNDSNIIKGIDFNDPGFLECSFMFAASNGKTPLISPLPVGESIFSSKNLVITDPFFGFLYYNDSKASNLTIVERAYRAKSILTEALGIELIDLDSKGDNSFYPFIGYYPNMTHMIDIFTSNIPQDGYWNLFDKERLSSKDYLDNHYLSTVFLMVDSIELLFNGLNLTRDYFNFDITQFGLSFMGNIEPSNPTADAIFSTNNEMFLALMGGDSSSLIQSSGLSNIDSLLGSNGLNSLIGEDEKMSIGIIQYEGNPEGIVKTGDNYEFNLYKALGTTKDEAGKLEPSEKIYLAIYGALLTGIEIHIYSAEVVDFTPINIDFSDNLIDLIEMATFFIGQGDQFDITILENYSIGLYWETQDGIDSLKATIINPNNTQDPINLLRFQNILNFPMIPSGLLNPIDDININYLINYSEPTLLIKKDINLENVNTGDFSINVTIINNGNSTAWGHDMGGTIFDSSNIVISPMLSAFIEALYGQTAEEFFNLDQNPRFFLIDLFGTGIYDTFYPQITNPAALAPYNPQLSQTIMDNALILMGMGYTYEQVQALADSVSNPQSIMNPENWYLKPGESINFQLNNLSLLPYYTYDPFYVFNYTTNGNYEPTILKGSATGDTTPENAHELDETYWELISEKNFEENQIELLFSFKEDEPVDLTEKSIDRVEFNTTFLPNITGSEIFSKVEIEYFNFSSNSFQQATNASITVTNTSIAFNMYEDFSDIYDPANSYRSYFKIKLVTAAPLKLLVDLVNFKFLDRELNRVLQNKALLSYTTQAGINGYIVQSNSIITPTDNAPLIQVQSLIGKTNSYPSEINNCTITLWNSGDRIARNLNLSIKIPGKIINYDEGLFKLENGYLNMSLVAFNIGQSITTTFSFYTPNTLNTPSAELYFENYFDLKKNESDFKIESNSVFISAPIDYNSTGKYPFIDLLSLSMSNNYSSAGEFGGKTPKPGEHIKFTITAQSIGQTSIKNIRIQLPKYLIGFQPINEEDLIINNLEPGIPKQVSFELNRTSWEGILYPPVTVSGSEEPILRLHPVKPIVLSYKNLSIKKEISDLDGVSGQIITVKLTVINEGNVAVENITVNDVNGFVKKGFRLCDGVVDKVISKLDPGENFSYFYTLQMKNQGIYDISAASIKYQYLTLHTKYSESYVIKVRNPWVINALWIIIPSLLGICATLLLYRYKTQYDIESAELQRREELMFGHDFRSIAWDKFVIEEHLDKLLEGENISIERHREEVL